MHSDDKLVWFYTVGAIALALAAIALQAGVLLGSAANSSSETPPKPTASSTPR